MQTDRQTDRQTNEFFSYDPPYSRGNLSLHYNHRHVNGSIKFTASFLPDEIYYLIVATASRKTTSSLSVTAIGPARINFNELGEH